MQRPSKRYGICYYKGVVYGYFGTESQIYIPNGVTKIEPGSFSGCGFLTSINIPDSITKIDHDTFSGCDSLKSINISNSVTEIGEGVFSGCTSLNELTILGHLTAIPPYTFEYNEIPEYIIAPEMGIEVLKKAKLMRSATMGFLNNFELFANEEIIAEYKKYAANQKKLLLPNLFGKDNVKAISWYAENGIITQNNFETDFLTPALEANATQCVAYLLNWKNENI